MKKFIWLIILLLITGCSKEESFTCEINNTTSFGATKQIVEVIGNESISKVIIKENVTIDEAFEEFYDTFYESINESFSTLKDKNGVTLKSSKENLDIFIELSVQVDKIDEETKNDFSIDVTKKPSEVQEDLINDGYTCN